MTEEHATPAPRPPPGAGSAWRRRGRWATGGALFAAVATACGAPRPVERPPEAAPPASAPPAPPASAASSIVSSIASSAAPPPTGRPMPQRTRATGRLIKKRTVEVGRWPERVVAVGDAAWITISGDRRVARVPLSGDGRATHVAVGRLPVALLRGRGDELFAIAETDRQVWRIDTATAKAKPFATLPDCPTAAVADGDALWVLLWARCSSETAIVAKVSLVDRKVSLSRPLARDAWAIAHRDGRSWVAHGDGSLSALEDAGADVATVTAPKTTSTSRVVTAGPRGLYVTEGDDVVRIDPATRARTHDARLDGRVLTLFADDHRVVAATRAGTVWILDPETLVDTDRLRSPVSDADVRDLTPHGRGFLWLDLGADREHGRLTVLEPDD